jgi:serine/threonine protein phosphatase PrpC
MIARQHRNAAALALASAWLGNRHTSAECKPSPKSVTCSVQASRGHRPYMEDEIHVSTDCRFAAIYDGHGGADVSRYLHENLMRQARKALAGGDDANAACDENDGGALSSTQDVAAIAGALRVAFRTVSDAIAERVAWNEMGSTAAVVLVQDETLISANVGDSRAVLSRSGQALALTLDHKPDSPSERARIEALGGEVTWVGQRDANGVPIVGEGVYRVNGTLAVSRSLGDVPARPYVSDEVEIRALARDRGADEFVLIASDGLWDVMSSGEAVAFVHSCLNRASHRETRVRSRNDIVAQSPIPGGGAVVAQSPMTRFDTRGRKIDPTATEPRGPTDGGVNRVSPYSMHGTNRRKRLMARYLMEEAMRRGSMDNITVIVLWLDNDGSET